MFHIWPYADNYHKWTFLVINVRKRQNTARIKSLCQKLANLLYRSSCCLILDDEKYFTYDGSNMQGNDNYHSNGKSKCQDSVRFAGKEKYHGKVMVWAAISNRGISKPLFRPFKSEAVDSDIYINEYIASFHPWTSPRLKLYFLTWFNTLPWF